MSALSLVMIRHHHCIGPPGEPDRASGRHGFGRASGAGGDRHRGAAPVDANVQHLSATQILPRLQGSLHHRTTGGRRLQVELFEPQCDQRSHAAGAALAPWGASA
jgi:hypothetical protein